MRKQSIVILSLIAIGSLFSVVYAATTIVSDDGIVTSNLVVTGTCTGCGGSEADYTSYSTALNETVAGTGGNNIFRILVSDDGSIIGSDKVQDALVSLNGTIISLNYNDNYDVSPSNAAQSETGKYKVLLEGYVNTDQIHIYKNNVLLENLTYTSTEFGHNYDQTVGISPNGKYISVYGIDSSHSIQRLLIFEGS